MNIIENEENVDKQRSDYSYYSWGEPRVVDEGKSYFFLNPEIGNGKESVYKIEDSLFCFKSDFILFKKPYGGIKIYKDDVIFFYKLLEGRFFVDVKKSRQMIVKSGDIVAFAGNDVLNTTYGFGEKIEILGFFCYYKDLLNVFKRLSWSSAHIENFYNNPAIQNILVYTPDIQIEELINSLATAINTDNRLLIKAKTLELLYYATASFKKQINENRSNYAKGQIEIVQKIKSFLDENLDSYYTMPYLAKHFGISLSRFQEIFRACYNISPYRYHLNKRLEKAKKLLLETDMKVADITFSCGFASPSKFTKAFNVKYSYTPSSCRKNKRMG